MQLIDIYSYDDICRMLSKDKIIVVGQIIDVERALHQSANEFVELFNCEPTARKSARILYGDFIVWEFNDADDAGDFVDSTRKYNKWLTTTLWRHGGYCYQNRSLE